MHAVVRRWRGVTAVCVVSAMPIALPDSAVLAQQSKSKPIPTRDGDIVVVEGDARVRIVHRREASVVAVYDPAERRLLVMVDFGFAGGKPDGGVDVNYRFHEVGNWPLGSRWAGPAVVEEYTFAGEFGGLALGLRTEQGLIQMLGPGRTDLFRDPSATVIPVKGTGRLGATNPESFELTEQRLLEQERRAAEIRRNMPVPPQGADYRISGSGAGRPDPASPAGPDAPPVRVGGNIQPPVKLVHVDGIKPEQAEMAGIRGVVIMEAIIGTDGSISDVKVLRSIPILDDAAVTAVKQWKYAPTLLNGVPVPVILTVTVNFQ